jgi:integrase
VPRKPSVPSYRLHRASGQAVVVIKGKSVYLGKWNTPASHAAFRQVVAEWLSQKTAALPSQPTVNSTATAGALANGTALDIDNIDLRINELIVAFFEHAIKYYRHADGSPTGEADNYKDALCPLRRLFGETRAVDFGPLRLRTLRDALIADGLSRTTINARIHRVRRVFRWGASMELIPVSVVAALNTVAALQRGRCSARESPGVRPVEWQRVEATLPHLPKPVAAMVEIMRYSNCRAADVVLMRPREITRSQDVWEYRPARHKNQWREDMSATHQRIVVLGPKCQEILRPFLDRSPDAYLFSPQESRAAYQAQRAARRTTKVTPSQRKRRAKSNPRRAPRDHYTVNTFQQTVRKTCQKIGVAAWTVLQVRHTRATDVRALYGLEGAAASLGNTVEAAQIYAEKNQVLARQIALEAG